MPLYFGGLLGAAAVVASGGALALAIAATIICSAGGATLGGLLADAVAEHHAKRVSEQLARGGIVIWLKTTNAEHERCAIAILRHARAHDVHVHEIRAERNRKNTAPQP